MATIEMVMPQMGESIIEGTILTWLKKEGDAIEQDESVLEVATDKVDTEVPATHAGILKKILAQEGEVVGVGVPIAIIETEEGIGSEFSFTIMARVPENDRLRSALPETEPKQQLVDYSGLSENFPANILLVEDNKINQKFMSIVFSQMGYQPDIARNGQEAIDMVNLKAYEIIFMDHQMPKMNGAEATKAIRGLKNGKTAKIIGLSANVLDKELNELYIEGKDGYLAKPVKIEEIAETIKNCFESMGS